MVASDVLAVVIGLVFAWFLLSLLVSAGNGAIAWLFQIKAKDLWRVLGGLANTAVADVRLRAGLRPKYDQRPKVKDLAAAASDVPFLARLYAKVRHSVPESAWRRHTAISNIPPRVLADALLSVAEETVTKQSLIDAASALGRADLAGMVDSSTLPPHGALTDGQVQAVVPDEPTRLALLQEARRVLTIEDIESVVQGTPQLSAAVRRVRDIVGNNERLTAARDLVEQWFNAEMSALSAYYRQKNRKIVAALGLVVVIVLQADSIRIVDTLWHDADLRTSVAGRASALVEADLPVGDDAKILEVCKEIPGTTTTTSGSDPKTTATTLSGAATNTTTLATTTTTSAGATTTTTTTPADAIRESRLRAECGGDILAALRQYKLAKVSYFWGELEDTHDPKGRIDRGDWVPWLKSGGVGRVITFFALLFGASFWYDALRRLVGLRGKLNDGD